MATAKKPLPKKRASKKTPTKKQLTNYSKKSWKQRITSWWQQRVQKPIKVYLGRRPHRSFRRTYRRDYVRSLKIPGYVSFTVYVWKTLWQQKKLFGSLIAIYALVTALLVGFASQDTYADLRGLVDGTSVNILDGGWGEIGKAGLLLLSGVNGSFTPQLTDSQQIYNGFLVIMLWLTTIWLLRAIVAGNAPRVRDGLYNAGSPLIAVIIVAFLFVLQLVPLAIAIIGYGSAVSSGLLASGALSMVFWFVAALLALLSLYWVTSTLMALVIVTLPGMYPWRAIQTAGDLVVGRRVRILLRFAWLLFMTIIGWIVIMIPTILFESWFKSVTPGMEWVPIVPVMILLVTSFSSVWAASYTYLFYRKVVDDDASPA